MEFESDLAACGIALKLKYNWVLRLKSDIPALKLPYESAIFTKPLSEPSQEAAILAAVNVWSNSSL